MSVEPVETGESVETGEPVGPGAPRTDADVPAWCDELGIPGIYDVHVHFLPPRVMEKVRAQFDAAGPLIGRSWPLVYRGDDTERVAQLRDLGVRRFTALPYAHRPGIAEFLNDWAAGFAEATPGCLSSATLYPEDGAGKYVAQRVEAGTRVFKVHVQVGDFDLTDPLLDEAWGTLADAGTPVVIHANSGPVGNAHTGPGPLRALLERFPELTVVIAHMGAPEYDGFLAIAEDFERAHLDTTMAFTDFFEEMAPFPRDLLPRLVALQPKVLLGSDFPNIPYPYAHQLEALAGLGLGEEWLRAVCWENGYRLLG